MAIVGILILYLSVAVYSYRKKWASLQTLFRSKASLQTQGAGNPACAATGYADIMPPLIDRPYASVVYDDEEPQRGPSPEDLYYDLEEDEKNVLLLEAEKVVEQIQETLNHIASNPPNREEVVTKISAIVSDYSLFHETEYFDAINSFISITVKRDCNIDMTKEEIADLWQLPVG
jgi:hypothetical protein